MCIRGRGRAKGKLFNIYNNVRLDVGKIHFKDERLATHSSLRYTAASLRHRYDLWQPTTTTVAPPPGPFTRIYIYLTNFMPYEGRFSECGHNIWKTHNFENLPRFHKYPFQQRPDIVPQIPTMGTQLTPTSLSSLGLTFRYPDR